MLVYQRVDTKNIQELENPKIRKSGQAKNSRETGPKFQTCTETPYLLPDQIRLMHISFHAAFVKGAELGRWKLSQTADGISRGAGGVCG